jgi:hypothetical protein
MTQSATAVTTTVGPAIGVGLTSQMLGSWGWLLAVPGAGNAEPVAVRGHSGLDMAVASQQGRRVG